MGVGRPGKSGNLLVRPSSPVSQKAKESGACLEGLCWNLRGPHSGSDELGLRNLMDAMNNYKIASNKALVVMLLSDENDACTPFKQNGQNAYSHDNEREMLKYCSGINATTVYNRMVQYAGTRPFAVGALVYTGQGPIPTWVHRQKSIGLGYTTVVAKAGRNGTMIDLASESFKGLQAVTNDLAADLGDITRESVGTHTQFGITKYKGGPRLNLNQVQVTGWGSKATLNLQVYVDGSTTKGKYTADYQNSLIRPLKAGRQVQVNFCLK